VALEAGGSTAGVGADVGRVGGGGGAMRRGRRHTSSIRFFWENYWRWMVFLGRKLVGPMVMTLFFREGHRWRQPKGVFGSAIESRKSDSSCQL
jgi:hypothetical protein